MEMTMTIHTLHVKGHTLAALAINPETAGQPVFLIHGITDSIYSWADPPPYLREAGPCYSLSLPGHYPAMFPAGFSHESLTAEMMARVLAAAIRELVGSQPVTLIGHSTGGFAALAIAAYTPPLARRVVSVAGFAHGQWTGALGVNQKLARSGALGQAMFKLIYKTGCLSPNVLLAFMRIYLADAQAFYAYPSVPALLKAAYPVLQQLDLDAMIHYFRRMPDIDISAMLPHIIAPTLVISGDHDPIVPPAQARLIAQKVPQAELALIPGAGHLVFAERAQAYNQILSDWLRRT
jgi:pimeloyl-ACP methyl ester carboxylesterase